MIAARKMPLLVALWMCAPLAASQESMRLCHNEDESFPWLLKHTPGFSQIMATDTAQALGIRLSFVPMRGAACLDAVAQGSVDGALSIIFLPERLQNMAFPGPAAGPADPEFRMYNNSVSLFHRKQDKMSWDGTRLQVNGVIGVRQGNFAARRLQALGAKVDSSSTSYLDLFKRLERGEVMAAAIDTLEGTETLRHNFSLRSVDAYAPGSRALLYGIFPWLRQPASAIDPVFLAAATQLEDLAGFCTQGAVSCAAG